MDAFAEIKTRLAALERRVAGLIRVGLVSDVNRETCRVRVAFPGNFVSDWLPVLVRQASTNLHYWMPDVDDQIVCIFLPTGSETGFALAAFYSDADPIPEGAEAEGMHVVEFADGARVEYNTEESTLRLLVGELEVTLRPDLLQFGGEDGNQPFVRGTDLATWLKAHVHPTGVGPSGPPTTAAQVDDTLSTIIKGR